MFVALAAPAGWCYQCNSRNPRCGISIDRSAGIDMTPCNGQCYMYMHKNGKYEAKCLHIRIIWSIDCSSISRMFMGTWFYDSSNNIRSCL